MIELHVPCGWKKGEPLIISKRVIHGKLAWYIKQDRRYFDLRENIPSNSIAGCWFYTRDEFAEFMQWWHT